MHTITHEVDTQPLFQPSVQLEKERPGNEARLAQVICGIAVV